MIEADAIYRELYPQLFNGTGLKQPIMGQTLNEVLLRPIRSDIAPHEVDLTTKIGPVTLNIPLISAAMDTVTGPDMAKVLSEVGGCGIIYRTKKPEQQLEWIKESLEYKPCLISKPECLRPEDPIEDAKDILDMHKFSTIPITTRTGALEGVLFTSDVFFRVKGRMLEPVSNWMKPFSELKTESARSSFKKIKDRLLNEQECSVLPIVSSKRKLRGIYFMKDFFHINLCLHKRKPLVGMAVGVHESDLDRAKEALKLGIGIIVIDSSHGNCSPVIEQTKKIVKLVKGQAAVIAGNVADVDGYLRLAEAGADGVKVGIGSGSSCTTSQGTGVGFPMFTLIKELYYTRQRLKKEKINAPVIIPDGGINGPGELTVSLGAGGHLCMAGKWLVAADESHSAKTREGIRGYVYYRGMASKASIDQRLSDRYGKQKKAPEGIEGLVRHRGPLKSWIGKDMELVQGGLAHVGARNIKELHKVSQNPIIFSQFSSAGQEQIATRLIEES